MRVPLVRPHSDPPSRYLCMHLQMVQAVASLCAAALSMFKSTRPFLGSPGPSRSHQGSKGRSWGPLSLPIRMGQTWSKARRVLVSTNCPTPHTGTNSSQICSQYESAPSCWNDSSARLYTIVLGNLLGNLLCTLLFSVACWCGICSTTCMHPIYLEASDGPLSWRREDALSKQLPLAIVRHQKALIQSNQSIYERSALDIQQGISTAS